VNAAKKPLVSNERVNGYLNACYKISNKMTQFSLKILKMEIEILEAIYSLPLIVNHLSLKPRTGSPLTLSYFISF
jgi:hypothetical protein